MYRKTLLIGLFVLLIAPTSARAQLDQTFEDLFNKILIDDFQLSPGEHADHFIPAAQLANGALTPALNSLISSNVASFPLSSTTAGVTFDFSTGQPVSITESQGPIFAEIAETVGRRKLVVGLNATHLSLDRFRGMPLEDLRFTFTHEDLGEPGLGDNPSEIDIVNVFPQLDVEASIVALYATYGVSEYLDVGVALPVVRATMSGSARAIVGSRTLFITGPFGGGARHFFDGDPSNPGLVDEVDYDDSATGIGDVALRLKYRFPLEMDWGIASLLDARLPTGAEKNFLGTGSLNVRLLVVASRRIGSFTPHFNVGYEYRGSDLDSNEAEMALGFDQKIAGSVTFAFDLLGNFDLSSEEAIRLYDPDQGPTTTITDRSPDTGATVQREVALSNAPDRDFDHTLDASLGFRIAPSERLQLLGNLIVPLQDGGLRSSVAPTIGVSVNL